MFYRILEEFCKAENILHKTKGQNVKACLSQCQNKNIYIALSIMDLGEKVCHISIFYLSTKTDITKSFNSLIGRIELNYIAENLHESLLLHPYCYGNQLGAHPLGRRPFWAHGRLVTSCLAVAIYGRPIAWCYLGTTD